MSNKDAIEAKEHPEVSDDDYDLALEADVEDESLLEAPANTTFSITSYGADYAVDTLISRLKSGAFYVPPFQRQFVWSQKHASRFIESLLMGLPVPGIFLYKEAVTNRHLVVDGQQRLRTLQYFYSGLFLERKFRLVGVRGEWEGKTYSDLDASDQLKLDDSIVHATIFQQDEPKDNQKSLYFVFEKINSGGIRLSPQEIRNCINDGSLLNLVRALNSDEYWRSIFGNRPNARLKDQELILRFLAMFIRGDQYSRPMRDFLNTFTSDFANNSGPELENLGNIFRHAVKLIWEAKAKEAFRPSRALNAAVFEAVMIGVARRIAANPTSLPAAQNIALAYDVLLQDKNFQRACERATADEETVKTRQSLATSIFEGI